LYFFSGTTDAFRFGVGADAVGLVAVAAAGMLKCFGGVVGEIRSCLCKEEYLI